MAFGFQDLKRSWECLLQNPVLKIMLSSAAMGPRNWEPLAWSYLCTKSLWCFRGISKKLKHITATAPPVLIQIHHSPAAFQDPGNSFAETCALLPTSSPESLTLKHLWITSTISCQHLLHPSQFVHSNHPFQKCRCLLLLSITLGKYWNSSLQNTKLWDVHMLSLKPQGSCWIFMWENSLSPW